MDVPEDIGGDGIETHGTGFAKTVAPVSAGHTGIVHLAREYLVGMAVKLKLPVGNRESVRPGGCVALLANMKRRENQLYRKKSSVHSTNGCENLKGQRKSSLHGPEDSQSVAQPACSIPIAAFSVTTRLACFYFAGDAVVFGARDDMLLGQIFGVFIRTAFDDALRRVAVNPGRLLRSSAEARLMLIVRCCLTPSTTPWVTALASRTAVDVARAVCWRISSGLRSWGVQPVSAISDQRYQSKKPHTGLDAVARLEGGWWL